MSASAVTMVFYLCAVPAADARVLACVPPRAIEAPSCEGAVARLLEQTPPGSVFLPVACDPIHPRPQRR